MHCPDYILTTCVFADITPGTSTEAGLGVEQFVVHRENKGRNIDAVRFHILDQFKPTAAFEGYVCENNSDLLWRPSQKLQCISGVVGLTHHAHVALFFKELSQ